MRKALLCALTLAVFPAAANEPAQLANPAIDGAGT
jgi:hypothetical protein